MNRISALIVNSLQKLQTKFVRSEILNVKQIAKLVTSVSDWLDGMSATPPSIHPVQPESVIKIQSARKFSLL